VNQIIGLLAVLCGIALFITRDRFVDSVEEWQRAHWGRWYPGRTPGGRWIVALVAAGWIIWGVTFAIYN
jgi:hypothetical protein